MNHSLLYPAHTPTRSITPLDGIWKFCFDPRKEGEQNNWQEGLSHARLIKVPGLWHEQFPDRFSREYRGTFWYETMVYVPREYRACHVLLHFDNLMDNAVIYLNGIKTAAHTGFGSPFALEVSSLLRYGQYNRISLQVSNDDQVPGRWSSWMIDYTAESPARIMESGSLWNSGIAGSVWMSASHPEYIEHVGLNMSQTDEEYAVEFDVRTHSSKPIRVLFEREDQKLLLVLEQSAGLAKIPRTLLRPEHRSIVIHVQLMDRDLILDEYRDVLSLDSPLL